MAIQSHLRANQVEQITGIELTLKRFKVMSPTPHFNIKWLDTAYSGTIDLSIMFYCFPLYFKVNKGQTKDSLLLWSYFCLKYLTCNT